MSKLERVEIGVSGKVGFFNVLVRQTEEQLARGEAQVLVWLDNKEATPVRNHTFKTYTDDGKMPRVTRLRAGHTEDFNIIYLITEEGFNEWEDEEGKTVKVPYKFGYALNVEVPYLSEWGYCP